MAKTHNKVTIVITTYGDDAWREMAWSRAYPSTIDQGADDVIVHHEPELTIGPARNAAASLATHKDTWFLFLDADDEFDSNYVQAMRDVIGATDNSRMTLFYPAVRQIRKGHMTNPFMYPIKDLRHDNFMVVGSAIHRSLFERVGGFSDYPHGFEDWSLWAKAWKAGAQVKPATHAFYHQFVNPRSKHRQLWRDRKAQVELHMRVQHELFPEGV